MESEKLLPYMERNSLTTFEVSRESGVPHASVKAQMAWLHRAGMIEPEGVAVCDSALSVRSGKYLVRRFRARRTK